MRDLCGHGVGLKFHEKPDVMHIGHKGQGMLLVPGMVFPIEPMINIIRVHGRCSLMPTMNMDGKLSLATRNRVQVGNTHS